MHKIGRVINHQHVPVLLLKRVHAKVSWLGTTVSSWVVRNRSLEPVASRRGSADSSSASENKALSWSVPSSFVMRSRSIDHLV